MNLKKVRQLLGVNSHFILEGDTGESLYIIKEGIVSCRKGDFEVRRLFQKDYFGESSILFGTKRSLSIIAITKITCYQISHSLMVENLGNDYKDIMIKSLTKVAFQKSKYMKYMLLDNIFDKIFSAFKLQFFKNDEIVISKDQNSKKIIVILEGNLEYISDKGKEIVATRGELFGENFIKKNREK